MLNRLLLSHSKTPDYNGVISIMCSWSAAHLHSACSGQNRWDRCQLNFCKGVLGVIWTRWPSSVGRSTQTFTFPKQQCFDVKGTQRRRELKIFGCINKEILPDCSQGELSLPTNHWPQMAFIPSFIVSVEGAREREGCFFYPNTFGDTALYILKTYPFKKIKLYDKI